ncbi:Gfo/Idh/MocA family oxidoreductase [Spirulina sp. CCNP1310]|uniref:Gfo/Idh/MocA family protein n=1 Tax=Spirulina sp. CCNP1310 TaxID=3110249 RepID=UPI002B200977|nr:Gfo/Idh/MocA family oxidoreductase [Spirulina sp. CCNP1310]MEA5419941.1 Gfo/Idh/MocA family oxidoreductase [Spirulina sp. CCNP1310]
MTARKIAIAVLGAGRWGRHFVRHFAQHPGANLVAVVDPHGDRLTTLQSTLNLPPTVVLAETWETLPRHLSLDAVVIATPASTHFELIKGAIAQGYHVLAEKPLTLDPAECATLTQAAQNRGVQLFVDHTYLFHPAVAAGHGVIQSGVLGDFHYGYATRSHIGPVRTDVDALWDLAIHDIAIFNHWLGMTPIAAQALGKTWLQPGLPDLVWATLTYPQGVIVQIHLCWANPDKQRRLALVGSGGTLIFDELQGERPLTLQRGYVGDAAVNFPPLGLATEAIPVATGESLGVVCDRFLTTIHTQTPDPAASGATATTLVQILTALSASLDRGGIAVPIN